MGRSCGCPGGLSIARGVSTSNGTMRSSFESEVVPPRTMTRPPSVWFGPRRTPTKSITTRTSPVDWATTDNFRPAWSTNGFSRPPSSLLSLAGLGEDGVRMSLQQVSLALLLAHSRVIGMLWNRQRGPYSAKRVCALGVGLICALVAGGGSNPSDRGSLCSHLHNLPFPACGLSEKVEALQ